MTDAEIVRLRLANHLLAPQRPAAPADVVRRFAAVQAQDYHGGLWAVGLRAPGATEESVERALAERAFVRTWPMRGTLHFVAAEDVRWMLELLTPRVIARAAGRYRQLELERADFSRSRDAVERALGGGRTLTRRATYGVIEAAGVSTAAQRGLHILGWLAQTGVICFAAREGKQQTFALLDEWVPPARRLERDAALAEVARRYFTSRGPATLRDFVWWTGLTVAEARSAVASVESELQRASAGGEACWFAEPVGAARRGAATGHLLPVYDEYTVAYRDRGAVLDPAYAARAGNGLSPVALANGRVVGTWKRSVGRDGVTLTSSLFEPLGAGESRALAAAARRYGAFLGMAVSAAST